ncbi:MAG: hypothetical protein HY865_06865 [Chloroflexi bacterium]|nr:hypothetical protein [Chloroflexota bacterium]
MNKNFFWIVLPLLTLTACSFNFGTIGSVSSGGAPAGMELPAQTKLVLGIINLEETENAVTAEQAKELVPMFYVLQDLNESDTAAQEEIDGLTEQIQETLTAEQTQAIETMTLSRQDIFAIVQGGGNSAKTGASESSSTSGDGMGGPPDMGGVPGGMPSGGGMPGGMPSGTTSSGTTSVDESVPPVMGTSTPSALFDAVIELLEKKLQ